MKTTTMTVLRRVPVVGVIAATAVLSTACRGPDLQVRTFEVQHIAASEAAGLVDPYVYGDRPGAPGMISVIEGAITVRETEDNLEQISRVLAQFDEPRPEVRLHFQLVEADGFTGADPAIATVEAELRKIFQFRGYRLAGETAVAVTDGARLSQHLRAADGTYTITAEADRATGQGVRLHEVTLWSPAPRSEPILMTTVNVRPGQTLVLGSSPKDGSSATLLLTVRAEEGSGPE